MVKTLLNTSFDSDGYLACEIFNDGLGGNYASNAEYIAPLIYYNDIPIQIKFHIQSLPIIDQIHLICPLGGKSFWFFEVHYQSKNINETANISSFNGNVQFGAKSIIKIGNGGEKLLCCSFRFKLSKICRPYQNVIPGVVVSLEDAVVVFDKSELHVNKNLLSRRSRYFTELFEFESERYAIDDAATEKTNFEMFQHFVKLASVHTDFTFDEKNIGKLMEACKIFRAPDCMMECVDYLFRTEKITRLDAALILEDFPELHHHMYNMAKMANSELRKFHRVMWNTDFRIISEYIANLIRTDTPNVNIRFYAKNLSAQEIASPTGKWQMSRLIETSEGGGFKSWLLTVTYQFDRDRFVTTCTTKKSCPWFVDATVSYTIFERNSIRPRFHSEHMIFTSESGCRKFNQKNRINLESIERVKIRFKLHRAFLNDFSIVCNNYVNRSWWSKLKVTLCNTYKGKPIKKTFVLSQAVLSQCSTFFSSWLYGNWDRSNEITLNDTPLKLFKTFLLIAHNPRIPINDNNFLNLLNATLYFGVNAMQARLEEYYRGCIMTRKTRRTMERKFPKLFSQSTRPYFSREDRPTLQEVEEWGAQFGEAN